MARRLLLTGLAVLAFAALAYAAVRLTFGPRPVYVNVRWAEGIDAAARQRLEERYGLLDGELREGTTWGYALTNRSRENIRTLVGDPAVADTHQIHRTAFRVGYFAERLPYRSPRAWIAVTLETLSRLALALGLIACALAAAQRVTPRLVRGPLVWLRTVFLSPPAALVDVVDPLLRWSGARIPAASAESVGAFRIVFGSALLVFLLSRRVSSADWITAWLVLWGVLFVLGAAARLSFVMLTIGVLAWAELYTTDISHHTVSALVLALVCLVGSRWGDAWSVDAWREARPKERASPQIYGFTIWAPSLVLGVTFAAAAFAKMAGGPAWILNGTVKYHFLSDSREALVDWGLRAAQNDSVAVLLSFGAIAVESLVIVAVLSRPYLYRAAAGAASLMLLAGFALFQGVFWPGWWLLLLSFLPWHLVRSTGRVAPAGHGSRVHTLYPAVVVLTLIAIQTTMSLLRLEMSPILSTYDMYSTTYSSPAEFEAKATDAHWLVAIDEAGRRHQCRLTRAEAENLASATGSAGGLPPDLRQRCLDPSLRVKTVTVEADHVRVDWARLRLEESGRVPLRSFQITD